MRSMSVLVLVLGVSLLTPSAVAAQEAAPSPAPSDGLAPNAAQPLTHDELLTLRGEHTQDDATLGMLVADAVIVRSPRQDQPDRLAGGQGFGGLPREGHPGDPVVRADDVVAERYPADARIEGLLAIEHLFNDALKFRGEVAMPGGTYLTPIEPQAMAAADALPVGTLIVARGWFSRLASPQPCPEVPDALDPNDAGGRSSPFVRCPGGWLTTDPVTEVDPGEPTAPLGFGIPVQYGALERFGRDLAVTLAYEPATYLLRHVANPIEDAEPALGWAVVGHLAPMTIPDPVTAADADDKVRPGGLDWQPGLERQPPADVRGMHSTAWSGGFASIHGGANGVLSSWVSADGRDWQGASLPRGIRWVNALLRLDDGLVLIADAAPFGKVWRYDLWSSRDGLAWRRVARQRIPTPDRFDDYRRIVHGYWTLGDRIVALETFTQQPCCGRSSGWTFVANREDPPDETFAWTSGDGKAWVRQRAQGFQPSGEHRGHQISQGRGELLALWGHPTNAIASTTDGIRWRTIGRHPERLDLDSLPMLLARAGDGIVLGGTAWDAGDDPGQAFALWRSTNGEDWQRTYARPDGRPASIVASGRTVIVAGNDQDAREPDADPPPELPWLMVSQDGGRTWDESLAWVGDTDWCLRSLTASSGSVSLDAACTPPDAASTYVVTLPGGRPSVSAGGE
jgi:hypothetical protein